MIGLRESVFALAANLLRLNSGVKRQKFILERTKVCYEELEKLRGDA